MKRIFLITLCCLCMQGCSQPKTEEGTDKNSDKGSVRSTEHEKSIFKEGIDRAKGVSRDIGSHDDAARDVSRELEDE